MDSLFKSWLPACPSTFSALARQQFQKTTASPPPQPLALEARGQTPAGLSQDQPRLKRKELPERCSRDPSGHRVTHITHGPFLVPSTQEEELSILLYFTPENTQVQRSRGTRSRSLPREGARPEPTVRSWDCGSGHTVRGGRRGGGLQKPRLSLPHSIPPVARNARYPTWPPTCLPERRGTHPERRETAAGRRRGAGSQGTAAPHAHSPAPGPRAAPSGRGDSRAARGRRGVPAGLAGPPPSLTEMRAKRLAAVPRVGPMSHPCTHPSRHKHTPTRGAGSPAPASGAQQRLFVWHSLLGNVVFVLPPAGRGILCSF